MRRFLPLVVFALLCACSSESPGSPGAPGDSAGTDSFGTDTLLADETSSESDSASPDVADTKTSGPKNCPACQATKCKSELAACGGSSACLDWLICWNDCYKTSDSVACQDTCMTDKPTPAGKKLEACSKTTCASDCLP